MRIMHFSEGRDPCAMRNALPSFGSPDREQEIPMTEFRLGL